MNQGVSLILSGTLLYIKIMKTITTASILFTFLVAILLEGLTFGQERAPNKDDQLLSSLLKNSSNQEEISRIIQNHSGELNDLLVGKLIGQTRKKCGTPSGPEALAIFNVAKEVAKKLQNKEPLAQTLYETGDCYFWQGDIISAIKMVRQSIDLYEAAGKQRDNIFLLATLGNYYYYQSDNKNAKEYSLQAIALAEKLKTSSTPQGTFPDDFGVSIASSILGSIAISDGDYETAINHFQKAIDLSQRLYDETKNPRYRFVVLDSLAELGRVYRVRGEHQKALKYFNEALAMARALGLSNRIVLIQNRIGLLYVEQDEYEKAHHFFSDGLQLARATGDLYNEATILLNLGVTYQKEGRLEESTNYFRECLTKAGRIKDAELIVAAEEGLGANNYKLGNLSEADEWLTKSLSGAQGLNDKTRIAEVKWRKAQVTYALGKYDESLTLAKDALRISHELKLTNISFLAANVLGKSYFAQKDYTRAASSLAESISQIEKMRQQLAGRELERQLFFESKVEPYYTMVDLSLEQGKPREALSYAEQVKGRILLDAYSSDLKVNLKKLMTATEQEQAKRLNRTVVQLNKQLQNEIYSGQEAVVDHSRSEELRNDLRNAQFANEEFQNNVIAAHPELKQSVKQAPELTREKVSGLSNQSSAVLEYVVRDKKTYLFVLTKAAEKSEVNIKTYSIEIDSKELAAKINRYRKLLADRNPVFSETARSLYDLLVKPAEALLEQKRVLCVVPDGILWELPFQALQNGSHKYLIEDYAIYYAPSLAVLDEVRRSRAARLLKQQDSLLAVGNPLFGHENVASLSNAYRGDVIVPLPETETEVKKIEDIHGTRNSVVYLGSDAREAVVKEQAGKFNILHFATHGILDDQRPLYSKLLLSESDDPDNDGMLEAWEIMQLDLHADLAVLSACQTARGRLSAGEGMIGMAWAFSVAGVPTTVVSQWRVLSQSTTQLMIKFHSYLKQSQSLPNRMSKAEALKQADLDLMKTKGYEHPFYWAGFVMVGDGN